MCACACACVRGVGIEAPALRSIDLVRALELHIPALATQRSHCLHGHQPAVGEGDLRLRRVGGELDECAEGVDDLGGRSDEGRVTGDIIQHSTACLHAACVVGRDKAPHAMGSAVPHWSLRLLQASLHPHLGLMLLPVCATSLCWYPESQQAVFA